MKASLQLLILLFPEMVFPPFFTKHFSTNMVVMSKLQIVQTENGKKRGEVTDWLMVRVSFEMQTCRS